MQQEINNKTTSLGLRVLLLEKVLERQESSNQRGKLPFKIKM